MDNLRGFKSWVYFSLFQVFMLLMLVEAAYLSEKDRESHEQVVIGRESTF